jgi:hypothetical protein
MPTERDFRSTAFVIVALGTVLAFAASVVPFYTAGHKLLAGLLLTSLLPYAVYGVFAEVMRGGPLLLAGILLLCTDLAVKIPQRFLHYDGYTDGWVYYTPILCTFVLLPLVLGGGRLLERRRPPAASSRGW